MIFKKLKLIYLLVFVVMHFDLQSKASSEVIMQDKY